MLTRKTLPKLTLALACSAAILWLGAGCGIIGPDYQCGTESLKQANKTREVALKYESLFKRQPNFPQAREGFLRDESTGRRTETWGIVVIVDGEKVDQDTLPPEDRIPDELEGVPVQIIPWQIAEKGDISQGAFLLLEILIFCSRLRQSRRILTYSTITLSPTERGPLL